MIRLHVTIERFPIAGTFTISRGSKREAVVVVAHLSDGTHEGRGECVPYARYGETVEGVADLVRSVETDISGGLDRIALQKRLPAGAARNALDCAFWDLEAKRAGQRVAALAGLAPPAPLVTAYTLSLDTPAAMAAAAAASGRPLLKLKLGGNEDLERLAAIRAAVPDARLIVDANEGWAEGDLERNLAACADFGVELVEQPLPAASDSLLARIRRPVPVCADESAHDCAGLATLRDRYDAVNVKLDKAGGLTEALAMVRLAHEQGFSVMVGCMLATSLAMAPAILAAQTAEVVDLDGPLLLAQDRAPGLRYEGSWVHPPQADLWG